MDENLNAIEYQPNKFPVIAKEIARGGYPIA